MVNKWQISEKYDYLEAEHFGYTRLNNPISHTRIIVFNREELFWVVKDLFRGEGKHHFNLYFNLNSDMNYSSSNDSLITEIFFKEENKLMIIPLMKDDIKLDVTEGWHSDGYGEKDTNLVIKYSKEANVPTEFLFVLALKDIDYSVDYFNKIIDKINLD